jgi:hypothetical protein
MPSCASTPAVGTKQFLNEHHIINYRRKILFTLAEIKGASREYLGNNKRPNIQKTAMQSLFTLDTFIL